MQVWRLLDLPPMTAAENMALDEVLLELRGQGRGQDTLRFLQFNPRTVLVGFHQSIEEEIRVSYCREQGIDINRRITGGGGLLFDESQIGWEIICGKAFFNVTLPTDGLFRRLCEPTVMALRRMGLDAAFRPRNDIEIAGRKITGTGGTDSENAFLFQGSLLMDFDIETMLRCLRIPIEKLKAKEIDSVRQRVTCLAWELERTPDAGTVKNALAEAFAEHFGVRLVPGGLTAEEESLLAERLPYFQSPDWIDMVRPQYEKTEVVQAAHKTMYGLARFTLVLNQPKQLLKNVYITGDFLSFPSRALFDLEARLRGKPLDTELLCAIVEDFFASGGITIPGMSAVDLCVPLRQALEKAAIARRGIPLEHCNNISVTNGSFDAIVAQKPSALLLPYCAKERDCDLRYSSECRACGECSVGDAWVMGEERGLVPICITNFEDLTARLAALKDAGTSAFIGCCCRPFFVKHEEDFTRLGLPGILLHMEDATCYDLGQGTEAYAGRYTNQTTVNLGLLRSVLEAIA